MSNTKWLANAKGIEIRGFGILVAMVAPTITCGVSSTVHYDILALKSMSNIILLVLLVVAGLFSYLFFLWKYLREDYETNKVFSFALATFIAALIGTGVGLWIGDFWFWSALLAYAVMSTILLRKIRFRLIEVVEASAPGYIVIYLSILLAGLFQQKNLTTAIQSLIVMFILLMFFVLKRNYKRFTWYRSGRLGFASLVSLGLLFTMRAIISIIAPSTISHIGAVGFIPSAMIAFFCFLTVYNLSND